MSSFVDDLREELAYLGIELPRDCLEILEVYSHLVLEKNKHMNLTGITRKEDIVTKQFVDSLVVLPYLDRLGIQKLGDLGSGAGFPSFPIGISRKNIEVLSMDALQKRISFQEEVINKLGLMNIKTVHGRAEEIGRNPMYRETLDCILSRAVTQLSVLLEYKAPLIRKDGYIICYKGNHYQEELENAKTGMKELSLKLVDVQKFVLKNNIERNLLIFKKTEETKEKYPRRNGIPEKKPL